MGSNQNGDELPALDNEQLDTLLQESEHVHDFPEEPALEQTESPAENYQEYEDPSNQENQAYLNWLKNAENNPMQKSEELDQQDWHDQDIYQNHEEPSEEELLNSDTKVAETEAPSPFERLYNANPELFDTMTVGEFVPHARELNKLENAAEQMLEEAKNIEVQIAKLESRRNKLFDMAASKKKDAESFLERYRSQEPEDEEPDLD